jgi:hypothetical protein
MDNDVDQLYLAGIKSFDQNLPLPKSLNPHLLVACFPKSGSTWLAKLLSEAFSIPEISLVHGWDGREQELCVIPAAIHHPSSYVAQLHVRHHTTTQRFLDVFHIRPIIQIRDLFDAVVSMVEFWPTVNFSNGPSMYMDEIFKGYDRKRLMEAAVEFCIPWYFNFYVSWYRAKTDKLWVHYKDLLADPATIIRNVQQTYVPQFDLTDADIQRAIDAAANSKTRKNKGISGRGKEVPAYLKKRIRNYASFYPDVDFSSIGL